eukprot:3109309-Pyramimonas_sp.AAC.1
MAPATINVLIVILILLNTTSTSPPLKSAAYEGCSWVPGPLTGGLSILHTIFSINTMGEFSCSVE